MLRTVAERVGAGARRKRRDLAAGVPRHREHRIRATTQRTLQQGPAVPPKHCAVQRTDLRDLRRRGSGGDAHRNTCSARRSRGGVRGELSLAAKSLGCVDAFET